MGNENNEKSQVYRELLIFALEELICLALMLGIFALLLPMIVMLAITMLIIILPAYYSFAA